MIENEKFTHEEVLRRADNIREAHGDYLNRHNNNEKVDEAEEVIINKKEKLEKDLDFFDNIRKKRGEKNSYKQRYVEVKLNKNEIKYN